MMHACLLTRLTKRLSNQRIVSFWYNLGWFERAFRSPRLRNPDDLETTYASLVQRSQLSTKTPNSPKESHGPSRFQKQDKT